MTLQEKMIGIISTVSTVGELTRGLNRRCGELCGVEATIPDDVPFPVSQFKGCAVKIHNVSYDSRHGAIRATVTLPYRDGEENPASGHNIAVSIDETWFK